MTVHFQSEWVFIFLRNLHECWPQGPECPHCGTRNVQSGIAHKTMTHRCRECQDKPMFSLRTGTVMQGSKLGYRVWAVPYRAVKYNHF